MKDVDRTIRMRGLVVPVELDKRKYMIMLTFAFELASATLLIKTFSGVAGRLLVKHESRILIDVASTPLVQVHVV